MQRKIIKKSVLPIYAFAAIWLIYALFFPLYKLWHFLLVLGFSVSSYLLFSRVTTKVTIVDEPEPIATGDAALDAIISEGKLATDEMRRLKNAIDNKQIHGKIDEIIDVSEKIIQNAVHNPASYPQVKKFLNYYLPTTIKLLNAYDRMYDQGVAGENISGSISKIEDMLDTINEAYKKQLDSLFANQALDIETDIKVMEGMLRREGFGPTDFKTSSDT